LTFYTYLMVFTTASSSSSGSTCCNMWCTRYC